MARVTQNEVKEIVNTEETNIQWAIVAANDLVTDLLGSKGLSVTAMKNIELFLSAHFLAMKDDGLRLSSEKFADDYTATYAGRHGQGLEYTRYGQQVLLLDTTGTFAQQGKANARFTIIGDAL